MLFYAPLDPDEIRRERRKAQELRKSQWWRQQIGKGVCYHCGERFSKDVLTMDHLIPVARGGKSNKRNCVVACKACNTEKGALIAVEKTLSELSTNGDSESSDSGFE